MPLIKQTALMKNIPNALPEFSDYVDWEQKQGKWSKRWLELLENLPWVSKKEGESQSLLLLPFMGSV